MIGCEELEFFDLADDAELIGFKRISMNIPHEMQIRICDKTYWYKLINNKEEE